AGGVAYELVGMRPLRADRGRQAEAHRAHAARGQPQARRAEVEVLRRPHLMLADARRDDRLAARELVDLFDDMVRLDQRTAAIVVHWMRAPELGAVRMPGPPREL